MLVFPPHMDLDFSHSSQYLRLKGRVKDLALRHSSNALCLLLANLPCCMCCSSSVSNAYLQASWKTRLKVVFMSPHLVCSKTHKSRETNKQTKIQKSRIFEVNWVTNLTKLGMCLLVNKHMSVGSQTDEVCW